jgi:hypothetical protein
MELSEQNIGKGKKNFNFIKKIGIGGFSKVFEGSQVISEGEM